nr:class I SAM-dependent methyltransferase [Nocardia neocaledoniensis]
MLVRYHQHVGRHHLEVGPGSGWYLAHTTAPLDRVTLMDLNPSPLSYTARRLRRTGAVVATARGSVLEPVPTDAGSEFDSIGINFVLHCVPGDFAEKGVAFRHLAAVLADDGTLFGSTILGRDAPAPTLFGRALSAGYSQVGAFNNADDDRVGLVDALRAAFDDVDLTDVGAVTLFAARSPRR